MPLIRPFFIATVLLAFALPGAASAPEDCPSIGDGTARLACYDAKYRPATVETTASAWTVRTETSVIDDSTSVFLSTEAEAPITNRFGQRQVPTMLLRCDENTTAATIYFGGHFMADIQGYGDVTFRVDDRPAIERSLDVSTSNQHLGYWSGGQAIPFIKSLFGGKALLVRATPFNENPVTFTLPIAGLEEAIAPLREACHW